MMCMVVLCIVFCFKQKTAYEMRISDWSSDVCSSDLMECIVRADDLDRHGIDLVNTNRTQLREDNEIVRALIAFVEEAMKKALAAHAKWKEEKDRKSFV